MRIDLHLHSDVSADGYFGPATVADKVAAAGVRFAALTDHQSLDGLHDFAAAFARLGGVAISGVEMHVVHEGRPLHLLAYGFDPGDAALRALVRETPSIERAIAVVHAAGGITVLAHPLVVSRDPEVLDALVATLRSLGLDGLEAVYAPYTEEERNVLLALADRRDMIVSGGSDFHGPFASSSPVPGVDMEDRRWRRFRSALPAFRGEAEAWTPSGSMRAPHDPSHASARWFLGHILAPTLLAIALFIAALFGAVLPAFEENLMARKRETIRELTNSAWSILAGYEEDERAGRLGPDEARARAREELGRIRYGPEGKDYFWITDTVPRMILHPYRTDLNGQDLSGFRAPGGAAIFVEFARIAAERDHGYVDYVWQWKDDPERLEPKESYIRIFRPWGWVIGTGLYIEDVRGEIRVLSRRIIDILFVIAILVGLLLAYVIHQSYLLERRRRRVEADLRASHARFRLLVEASTEGTLMAVESRCAYANPTLLRMTGYTESELPFLDLADLFPPAPGAPSLVEALRADSVPTRLDAALCRRDRRSIRVLVTPTRVEVHGRPGWILVLREMDLERSLDAPPGRSPIDDGRLASHDSAARRLSPVVGALLHAGVEGRAITGVMTRVSIAAAERLIAARVKELGPPPVPFAWLVFGSDAREERTLLSDQDNGLLHADPAPGDEERVAEYFRRLGLAVCDDLERAGYPRCRGDAMAQNPRWCRSLSGWKELFTAWIREPNPEELLRFNIFFDRRTLGDVRTLADELQAHVAALLRDAPSFYFHLAANALKYRAPLGLFGRIKTDDPTGEEGTIDLKESMLPIVNFARLYALRFGLRETNTRDRLVELRAAGVLDSEAASELVRAYDVLLDLRLRHQVAIPTAAEESPDNRVAPAALAPRDRAALKEALVAIAASHRRIVLDYPGAETV